MNTLALSHNGWASPIEGLGPGIRTVLWVTGCERRCRGCISPELQRASPSEDIERVLQELLPAVKETGRLTLTGGEPFGQAEALAHLVDRLRDSVDVEVFVYSGYTLEELAGVAGASALLERADLLMDGEYFEEAGDRLAWRGSDNQVLHLLSQRARLAYGDAVSAEWGSVRPLTVQELPGRAIRLVGIPSRADWRGIERVLGSLGYELDR